MARRICSKCGTNYNLANIEYGTLKMPPLAPKVLGICDKCHGTLYQRDDDQPVITHIISVVAYSIISQHIIEKRLQAFDQVTDQLVQAYQKRGILVPFELTGGKYEMWPLIQKLFQEYGFSPDGRNLRSENTY
jgi:adenylate kinase